MSLLTNSKLHSKVTGDCINVKYGKARIENCQFLGNDEPDTDAIDYDGVEGGVIKNCLMSNFRGFNSDAIDIGEKSSDLVIDSIVVCNITDKGVSLGQRSTATIQNAAFHQLRQRSCRKRFKQCLNQPKCLLQQHRCSGLL